MESPSLRVYSELQPPAYASHSNASHSNAVLSCIFDLCHSLWHRWILNPRSEARDQTHILLGTSQVLNVLDHSENSPGSEFRRETDAAGAGRAAAVISWRRERGVSCAGGGWL